jgi:glyoxylase-like metal-dependent hydrolase (beta-lactamase superfamily II)
MPHEARLDEIVARVLAPNPPAMALDGTNTYVIGRAGSGSAALIDAGPPDAAHLARIRALLSTMDAHCELILVTHHHIDHAEAARPWASELSAMVAAGSRAVAGESGRVLRDGEVLWVGDLAVEVVATPGHCADHLAFRLDTGAVVVGDHILGRGPPWSRIPRATCRPTWSRCAGCTTWVRPRCIPVMVRSCGRIPAR